MQQIIIEGLAVDTLIGVYDWERERSTRLLLDIVLDASLSKAMKSDSVTDTIDYAKLAEHVQTLCRKSKFYLLEALGDAILTSIFEHFSVNKIELTIVKVGILPDANRVALKFEESRAQ